MSNTPRAVLQHEAARFASPPRPLAAAARIEKALEATLAAAASSQRGRPSAPPQLAGAMGYAVTPGGARVRPTLCLAVASACGDDRPTLADAAACAVELVHCASLAHDDLPCFDDADTRRGKPSVHCAFGEPIAVLTGDALIFLAFEGVARVAEAAPSRAVALMRLLAEAGGSPAGICAGQAWESEPRIDLAAYHQAKTGALFVAATQMGAAAAGQEPELWRELGARIGEAFQIADDLKDALSAPEAVGKPVGQDAAHDRPNAVASFGVEGAVRRLRDAMGAAIASIPSCPGERGLCAMVRAQAERLTPVAFAQSSV